ncbi:MAG: hypothetical protein AAB198_01555 [Actinomycetota bacterium]
MTAAVPGILRQDDRPPIAMDAAPAPGTVAASRPTVVPRPWIRAGYRPDPAFGHHPTEAAVRRYWTALIGPGAVADLLRLIAAAGSGRLLREPLHLAVLAAEDLAHLSPGLVLVSRLVPHLDAGRIGRLRPSLRAEYRGLISTARAPR